MFYPTLPVDQMPRRWICTETLDTPFPWLKLYHKNRLCSQNVHIKSQLPHLMFDDVAADDGSWATCGELMIILGYCKLSQPTIMSSRTESARVHFSFSSFLRLFFKLAEQIELLIGKRMIDCVFTAIASSFASGGWCLDQQLDKIPWTGFKVQPLLSHVRCWRWVAKQTFILATMSQIMTSSSNHPTFTEGESRP